MTILWKREHHSQLKGIVSFWRLVIVDEPRYKYSSGFIQIGKIQKGAPASVNGGKYLVEMNTSYHLEDKIVKTLKEANKVASRFRKRRK